MTIRLATSNDLANLCDFYQEVCAQQRQDQYSPRWTWGDYPSRSVLQAALNDDQIMVTVIDGQIVAAGVLSVGEDPAYREVPWQHHFANSEIAILHLFAVSKHYRGHDIAQQLLQAIIQQARTNGQRVIHLDIINPNVPAEKAYLKAGFQFNNAQILDYDDLGSTPAKLFEYPL
ncbi:GNAT family N-acetyltransferase [uncultured Limosilactobacillus sp.]|uniref:GNAT family N-acetyltransferase n=1 Tax=uncultured Limosilactobacillus sp. TaxID=2837629 RepID=UPI0025F6B2F8|nr:GNAT family N-acetyltransferase [uncultured Limosilactobacillus sp.]